MLKHLKSPCIAAFFITSLVMTSSVVAQRIASDDELDCLIWQYDIDSIGGTTTVWVHAETGDVLASGRVVQPYVAQYCLVERECYCAVRRTHFNVVEERVSESIANVVREEHSALRSKLDNLSEVLTTLVQQIAHQTAQQVAQQAAADEVARAMKQLPKDLLQNAQREQMTQALLQATEKGKFREALVDLMRQVVESQKSN